jgi:SRSO17 transposase
VEIVEFLGRVVSRFSQCETLRNAGALMLGLVSDLGRKNCWTLAERAGHPSPDRLQHLLTRDKWDTDGVLADLRGYVSEHLGDPDAVLGVDETSDLKKGRSTVGVQPIQRHRRSDRKCPSGSVFGICCPGRAHINRPAAVSVQNLVRGSAAP